MIVNNILYIYQIHTKLGMEIYLYMLFICIKFQGNWVQIGCFIKLNNLSSWKAPKEE